mgnify:CR=1 FL=1
MYVLDFLTWKHRFPRLWTSTVYTGRPQNRQSMQIGRSTVEVFRGFHILVYFNNFRMRQGIVNTDNALVNIWIVDELLTINVTNTIFVSSCLMKNF